MTQTILYIGQTPQYFFDNHIIEMVNFVTRTMHTPKRHGDKPVIKKDRPWEKVLFFRTNTWNVFWDPDEKLYKCWYEDLAFDFDVFAGRKSSTHGLEAPGFHEMCDNRYLYAESKDGVNWDKPLLDYRKIDGQKTSICLGNERDGKAHAATFLLDPLEKDSSKRFKVLFWNEKHGVAGAINRAGYSADGRCWTLYDQPVTFGESKALGTGDVIIASRDPLTGEYIIDTRIAAMCEYPGAWPNQPNVAGWGLPIFPNEPTRNAKRRIYYAYSRDFLNWTALQEILKADPLEDILDDEYYGMARFRMGDLWVALLNKFHRTSNTMTVHLVYSRDGANWHHAGQRRAFMDLGPDQDGTWDRYLVEVCSQPLFLEDEIRIYYAGSSFHHDWWQFGIREGLDHPEAEGGPNSGETALGLATLRPEGFVSLDTGVRDGILVTRPFTSPGGELIVNVQCGQKGYFQAALLDSGGSEIPGYERSACDSFRGDSTKHVVTWSGKSQLPTKALAKGIKLCVYSKNTQLYSFRITGSGTE